MRHAITITFAALMLLAGLSQWVSASYLGKVCHGNAYVSSAGTVTIGAQSTWYKLDAAGITWADFDSTGFTFTGEELVSGENGDFSATWCISFYGTNGKNYEMTLAIDDNEGSPTITQQAQCKMDRDLTSGQTGIACGTCGLYMATGDSVYIMIQQTNAPVADITVSHATLQLSKQH